MIMLGYAVAAVLVLLPGLGIASAFQLDPWTSLFAFAICWGLVSGGLYLVDSGLKADLLERLQLRNGFLNAVWPGWLPPISIVLTFIVLIWVAMRGTAVGLAFLQIFLTSRLDERPQVMEAARASFPEFMAWLASPFGLNGLILAAGLAIAILSTTWEAGKRRENDLERWNRK